MPILCPFIEIGPFDVEKIGEIFFLYLILNILNVLLFLLRKTINASTMFTKLIMSLTRRYQDINKLDLCDEIMRFEMVYAFEERIEIVLLYGTKK